MNPQLNCGWSDTNWTWLHISASTFLHKSPKSPKRNGGKKSKKNQKIPIRFSFSNVDPDHKHNTFRQGFDSRCYFKAPWILNIDECPWWVQINPGEEWQCQSCQGCGRAVVLLLGQTWEASLNADASRICIPAAGRSRCWWTLSVGGNLHNGESTQVHLK